MLIIDMPMPTRCFDCPMHDWTYGLHETRQNVLVCNARHELTPILCQTIPNGDERPDWCPIVGVLPEQHGDLVDTDTVLWGEEVPDSEGIVVPVTIGDVIEGYDVPIIIAAERSKT